MKAKIVRWSPHSLSTEVGTIQTLSGHLGVNSLPYSLLLLPSVLPILNTDLEAGPHSEFSVMVIVFTRGRLRDLLGW